MIDSPAAATSQTWVARLSRIADAGSGTPESDPSPLDLVALVDSLAQVLGTAEDDAQRITQLDALERVKAACAAAQTRITAEFVDSQAQLARDLRERAQECSRAGDFEGWVAARDQARRAEFEATSEGASAGAQGPESRGRSQRSLPRPGSGVSAQVGMARRESPARAGRIIGFSLALVRDLPHTLAALTAGVISERRAEIVARGTSHLGAELRTAVDLEVIGKHPVACGTWGDRELEHRVRACADRLDAQAAVERARTAERERRVTIRPIPDTMAIVSAVLPVAQAVAVHAALTSAAVQAKAAGDVRTQGQVMADTLTERVTGQSCADDVHVEVQLVMTDRALLQGDETPAHIPGYGPVPAGWARELLTRSLPEGGAGPAPRVDEPPGPSCPTDSPHPDRRLGVRRSKVWLRRLFTHPATGTLVAMESKRRLFPPGLRRYLVARDGVCRTPWCDAPIRHADHVVAWAEGGSTTDANGAGLCIACNLTKESPGWRHLVEDPGPGAGGSRAHRVRITTPTGHTYTSVAPPVLPGVVELISPRRRSPRLSPLEASLTARLAS